MSRLEEPPFARGETWYNGQTIDLANLGGVQLEGKEYWFEDIDLTSGGNVGAKQARTGKFVKCRIFRNMSGVNLLPKRLVHPQTGGTDGRFYVGRVDGYACIDATIPAGGRALPVDEYLSAAGVPNGDLFYVVEQGPAMCTTPFAGATIAVGDAVVALTAATTAATQAGTTGIGGRVQNFTASTVFNTLGMVGRALSAMTTGQTCADVLVDINDW